jgi:ABC-type branched-subunit amino acid transport system ATPase component
MSMIETYGLTRKFGSLLAVENINLEVKRGEVLAFLGPNGAGKTTTTRMLSGIISPTSGYAMVAGHHDWDNLSEHIWLSPNLPYEIQEAVAAHELAHVLQKAQGYCQTASQRYANQQPIFPQLYRLGGRVNSLVLDVMADHWAAKLSLSNLFVSARLRIWSARSGGSSSPPS